MSYLLSSYFVDLDSDCLPELLLFRENGRTLEVWKSGESGMELGFTQSLDSILNGHSITGIPTFADMGELVM